MIRFNHEMEKAKQFVVDIEGDVQRYALSFLHIINNARENKDVFYKVKNHWDNRVFVTFNPDDYDNVKEYLENFGKIVAEYDIQKVNVYVEYDGKDYDTLYPEDCDDTEFFIDAD